MHRLARTSVALTLAVSLALGVAAPAAAGSRNASEPAPQSRQPKAKAGEVIVVFEPGVSANARRDTAARVGVATSEEAKVGRQRARLVRLGKGVTVDEAIAKYSRMPGVAYAQPNFLYDYASVIPNDPHFRHQWGLHNDGKFTVDNPNTPAPLVDADIDAPEAWDTTTGSPDVVVAVLDGGVDYLHPDLQDNIWVNVDEIPANGIDDDHNEYVDDIRGWNTYGAGNNDPQDADPDVGHGTHVAGIIAASGNNLTGISGVAPGVKIMPVRIFPAGDGQASSIDAMEGIDYAITNGADIINASWGAPWNKDPNTYEDIALQEAIEEADVLFVAAAGNDHVNNDGSTAFWPATSDSPNVISVGAMARNERRLWFSNYGRYTVDVFAPGEYIASTIPLGSHAFNYTYQYAYMNGTSMAAPHVSGVAALVLSANPSLSARQVRRAILENVDYKTEYAASCASGGRLNADRAVRAAATVPLVADVDRLSGADRYETAVEIARGAHPGWTGVTHIVVASGEDRFAADPLAAAGLVWAFDDAPLMLGSYSTVPQSVRTALREIGSANDSVRVHVVGGTNVIPDARMPQILAELQAGGATDLEWDRIAGRSRYETAAEIARVMREQRPGEVPAVALIANGAESSHFPDALALSAVCANTGAPILLTGPSSVPSETAAAIAALPQPTRVIVGGGEASVSDAVIVSLGAERWYGGNRYSTAVAIANHGIAEGWLESDAISVASSLADALSGANIAAASDGPVLLTQSTVLSTETKTWLTAKSGTVSAGWVLGGTRSVSRSVATAVESALDWQRQ